MEVTFLDQAEAAMGLARDNFQSHNLSAGFVVGDALDTKLPAESFDAVVSIGLAEHFPPEQVKKLFAEEYRLLKSGGVMISLNIPGKFSIQSLNTLMRLGKKVFGHYQDSVRKDYFRNNLKARDFAALAKAAGFSQTVVTHVCPFPIWVPIKSQTDRLITTLRRWHLRLRKLFLPYPFKTNSLIAQAHFLVAIKD